ncbi:hypothetical protein KDA_42640 [Dictyobacter alpinus]|uniref:Uncharacterized protein n=1 Tax=Dictyobacter alpinus TaxID=2014873 RepID=A0A402BBV4_9CHLR|nr:hypothetical protein KDA_42640 [Dictyobacter alpinus]
MINNATLRLNTVIAIQSNEFCSANLLIELNNTWLPTRNRTKKTLITRQILPYVLLLF